MEMTVAERAIRPLGWARLVEVIAPLPPRKSRNRQRLGWGRARAFVSKIGGPFSKRVRLRVRNFGRRAVYRRSSTSALRLRARLARIGKTVERQIFRSRHHTVMVVTSPERVGGRWSGLFVGSGS